ncbi:MAG: ElyC/SanA/YdcF family protein [bacterium]|nr:ElyC/SanA/YdcF family protein [bacterium]
MKKACTLFIGSLIAAALYGDVQFSYRPSIVLLEHAPKKPVALVLGASLVGGEPSPALEDRLIAGFNAYNASIVEKIIVSGDNRALDYNEPMAMKRFLLKKGMPEKDIVLDYAGRRTYDSCYRLRDIFEQKDVLVVTHYFHLPRALYLCNRLGVRAIGVPADTREHNAMLKWRIRELLATYRAWLDIHILKPKPVLGEKEEVF